MSAADRRVLVQIVAVLCDGILFVSFLFALAYAVVVMARAIWRF